MALKNSFYKSISPFYDDIFPYNQKQLEFIEEVTKDQKVESVLDIGCGTGNLALELARRGYEVSAVDADTNMITEALDKKRGMGLLQFPQFRELDMEKLADFFDKETFDIASCYGNTLPHLLSYENIEEFLKSTSTILKKQGHFAAQLLNYDYILDNQVEELPVKENENIRFERYYEYPENSELIDFITKLTVKETNEVIENKISLFPIHKADLKIMLEVAGFKDVKFYGDFDKRPLKKESIPLVFDCVKK